MQLNCSASIVRERVTQENNVYDINYVSFLVEFSFIRETDNACYFRKSICANNYYLTFNRQKLTFA